MNSLERMVTVLDGGIPDRVPVGLHNFLMACRMYNLPFDQITRGDLMAEAQLHAWRTFGHDVIMHEMGVTTEAEAMGCKIRYRSDQPPHVEEPLIKELDDINKLTVPDPETTYPLNEMLKTTRILVRETKGEVFINGRSDQGPIALAFALCGPEQFLNKLLDPNLHDWVNQLLDICSKMNIAFGRAQRRAGAHCTTIGLVGTSLISPRTFDELERPRAAAFCRAMLEVGCKPFVHSCGNESHLLDNLIGTGASALELDPGTDPTLCKAGTRGRTCVLGMLETAHVLASGTTDTVRDHVRETMRIMAPGGGFIIGPGCALPADTRVENIQTLMETVRQFGHYNPDGSLPSLQ